MRAVIQRVTESKVEVASVVVGRISKGILILLGVGQDDTESDADYLAAKIANLRIFTDSFDKMNMSCIDVKGEALVISQFTLFADSRKGRRPSYTDAALPDKANSIYKYFCKALRDQGVKVEEGIFQAYMQVYLINDGPVTLMLDSRKKF